MKRIKNIILLLSLSITVSAQNYYDDIYYTAPKTQKATIVEPTRITTTTTSSTTTTTSSTVTSGANTNSVHSAKTTRDIDEYNRYTPSTTKSSYNNEAEPVTEDYTYTSRIARFYDSNVATYKTMEDDQYSYRTTYNYTPQTNYVTYVVPATPTISLSWGWGCCFYDPWYRPWYYDRWYYDPWYYNRWGYYGPYWHRPPYRPYYRPTPPPPPRHYADRWTHGHTRSSQGGYSGGGRSGGYSGGGSYSGGGRSYSGGGSYSGASGNHTRSNSAGSTRSGSPTRPLNPGSSSSYSTPTHSTSTHSSGYSGTGTRSGGSTSFGGGSFSGGGRSGGGFSGGGRSGGFSGGRH